jgi:hypothetical protein
MLSLVQKFQDQKQSLDVVCGKTNLNYTGSSALILSLKAVSTQPHFKRYNPMVCQVKS